jgi:dTDP-4-dehydrorhamnose 3,5-epimerase-like enzyme
MSFKLSSELTFKWPIKVLEPDQSTPGKLVERVFMGHFAIIEPALAKETDAKRRAILEQITEKTEAKDLKDIQALLEAHDFSALKDVLRGWHDLLDEDDKPIPFNSETLKMVYAHQRVKNAFNRAYQEAVSEDKARLGN